MKIVSNAKRRSWLPGGVLAGAALGLAIAGCGSNSPGKGSTPSTSQVNHYFGTSNPVTLGGGASGGVWSVALDDVTHYFSYDNIDSKSQITYPRLGKTTAAKNGILSLALQGGAAGSGGYAVSLPGEGLLLRPGSHLANAIGATVANACPSLTSQQTFNFVALGTTYSGDLTLHVAYGSLQAASSSAGTWTFSNFDMFTLSGSSLSPAALPKGNCAPTNEGFVIALSLPDAGSGPNQTTVGISPSGLLVVDQGQNAGVYTQSAPGPTGPMGLVGVARPATALNVADMVGKTYAGFESEPLGQLGSVAVVFGATPGSQTAITGGAFPNDDVTQQPLTDTALDLGSQSAQTPGLFPSVTLTRPDSFSLCKGTPVGGSDAKGNPTCIFHGVAVAGQVAGKYVIFANVNDPSLATITLNGATTTPLAVLNMLLYQQ